MKKLLNGSTEYIKNPRQTTNLRLNLEYFNTSSAIWLAKIVKTLCSINNNECTLIIHVYFSIEDYNSMEMMILKMNFIRLLIWLEIQQSLELKIYATDDNGEILKESMVLLY